MPDEAGWFGFRWGRRAFAPLQPYGRPANFSLVQRYGRPAN
ncbi:hypothetical protein ACWD26_12185 [Streptomyces sp. NPDC002787]